MSTERDETTEITRRELIVTGVGYALAVSPITAWAITTPAQGLDAGDVVIPLGAEKMRGYWAMPKGKGPFPVVLVIHEIFGVHEYIKDVCRRLAKEGYLAISPDLYFRYGDATKEPDKDKLISGIVSKTTQGQVMADLDTTLAWLAKNPKADTKRASITGFCWGGNVTWMYAAHNPSLKAGIAWYGRLSGDKTPSQPKFPLDVVAELKVPVLGLYGEKDSGIPLDQVEKMRAALKAGATKSDIIVYTGAAHGFHADYRPSYDEKSAKEAWKKLLEWLKVNR